jgi:hypothetical protein
MIGMACIVPQASNAEPVTVSTEIVCDETVKVTNFLLDKYKELPILIGDTSDMAGSKMSIWSNSQTKTWTIIATKKDVTCIIGVGDNLNIFKSGKFSG